MYWRHLRGELRAPENATHAKTQILETVRSEKLQNESFPNFLIFRPEFCPEFCSEFSPNFLRSFCASFCGRRRPEKIHQKSPPFFNAKFPGNFEEKIHKMFLESGQSKKRSITCVFGCVAFSGALWRLPIPAARSQPRGLRRAEKRPGGVLRMET